MNEEGTKLSTDNEGIWEEARDRLKLAMDAESDNRARAKEDLAFVEGDQWDHQVITSESTETPELVINITDAFCDRVVNNIKEQRPRGKCHPVGDGADIELANIINGIGRHIEYRSEASVAYDTAADLAVKMGWGYIRIIPEYVAPDSFEQDLRILPVMNSFLVYMDPSAIMPTGQDAMWCIISGKIKRTEFKRLYPNAKLDDWTDGSRDRLRREWESKESIRIAEYFRIRETPEKLYLIRNVKGAGEYTRFKDQLPDEETMRQAGDYIADERLSSRRHLDYFKLNGTTVIEKAELPGEWIPVVRVQGKAADIDGKVIRRGMVRMMQDPQKMVNYSEVAKIKRLALTPQASWVGAEGQFDGHPEWDLSNNRPYAKLEYKPITVMTAQGEVLAPPPQRQAPAQVESGWGEMSQSMKNSLLLVSGMENNPAADTNSPVTSGVAIQRRQGMSDKSHYHYYDNLTLAIAQIWRVMLGWIPTYYSEPGRIQRIIGEDGIPQMVTLNQEQTDSQGIKTIKNDTSVGRYDVVMQTGPGYETKRQEGSEALLELLGVAPLAAKIATVGPDLVIRSIDAPYMEELADRFQAQTPEGLQKLMEQMPQQARSVIQSMSQQIQALQQKLQQDESGVTKTQMQTAEKMHATEVRAQTEITREAMKNHGEMDRELVRAGAKLIDSLNVGGGEKDAEGKQLIQRGERANS